MIVSHKTAIYIGSIHRCEVVSAKDERGLSVRGLFGGRLNSDQDCELFLSEGDIDKESNESFEVEVLLDTLSAYANPTKMRSKVLISVLDLNDNAPQFVYDSAVNNLVLDQYLTAIPDTTPIDQMIFRVKAEDADSGAFGDLEYTLTGDRLAKQYFAIDPRSGEIRNQRNFDGIADSDLPFELIIVVRDNPEGERSDSNTQRTMLVVNLLRSGDGLVLTIISTPPERVREKKAELVKLLQDQTNLAISVDRITPSMRPFYENGTCCKIYNGDTDVYFHATDPNTNEILQHDDPKVLRYISRLYLNLYSLGWNTRGRGNKKVNQVLFVISVS